MQQFAQLKDGIFTQYATQNTPSKSYKRNTQRGRPFDSAGEGGGGLAVWPRQNIYFQSFAGDNIYFHPPSAKTIQDIAYLNLMDAGLYIYFPRDPGDNIYFEVFDGQNINLKKLPPPPESTVRPLTKKGTSFNHSQMPNYKNSHVPWALA